MSSTSSTKTPFFEINSYTYNLYDINSPTTSLLQKNHEYIIPIYQRPYSWNELQIETLVKDIFLSFWGHEKESSPEAMFIGTMQLSNKVKNKQFIIDGQQRITTLTLFLKLLSLKYKTNETLKSLNFKCLKTDVNNGEQLKDLEEVLSNNKFDNKLNKYATNYELLDKYLTLSISNDKEDNKKFDSDKFIEHLIQNLYFVVIETKAGLSKTIQIFNAINTTGLDLNSTDIFKIRIYEYLSKGKTDTESKKIFTTIDELYEKIDIQNKSLEKKVTDMNGILSIYKYYLISNTLAKNKK